jgi:hypothetical protein
VGVAKRNEPCPHRDATSPEPRAEQTVEVVGIHEGGTRCAAGGAGTPRGGGNTDLEWTHWGQTEEGGNAGEAHERRIRRLIQGESRRTEGGAKSMEDALGVSFETTRRVGHGKTPRTTAAMHKVEGGAAKFQRAATASDWMRTHSSREQ